MKLRKIISVLAVCALMAGCGQVNEENLPPETTTVTTTVTASETTALTTTEEVTETEAVTTSETTSAATTTTSQTTTTTTTTTTTARQTQANNGGGNGGYNYNNNNYQENYQEPEQTQAPRQETEAQTQAPETQATEAPTETKVTEPPAVAEDLSPEEMLGRMTLEQKACQLFIVAPETLSGEGQVTKVSGTMKDAISRYPVGGIILFDYNMTSRDQTVKLLRDMQSASKNSCGVGMFTAVDEEGGFVARCAKKLGTTSFNNMYWYGLKNDRGTAYFIGNTIGNDIGAIGFNVDFAPVADVNIDSRNELGDRIFSSDPNVVANMVCGVVSGLQDSGVCATLKHFPGLGAENGNTHTNSFVTIDRTEAQLRKTEFVPFKAAIDEGADFVMVGHQIVTGFGDKLPSDLSHRAVTDMLRGELGFDGIAITDSQMMNTISNVYTPGQAAVMSIQAGIDIVLMPADIPDAVNSVVNAVNNGDISEDRINESVLRILRQKKELGLF